MFSITCTIGIHYMTERVTAEFIAALERGKGKSYPALQFYYLPPQL